MNKPVDPLFTTRPTITLELPLPENTRILRPEQVILKIGNFSTDIGAFCYAQRSSRTRAQGQPREVILSSLLKPRLEQIRQLIGALSALVTDGGKRLSSVINNAETLRLFLDWADANGLHDCLAGGEATRHTYLAWTVDTRERYRRQEFGEGAHNNRLNLIRELLEVATGLEDLGRGTRKVKRPRNPNGGSEPLAQQDFDHAMALNQALFDGLCELVLERRLFPYKLAMPVSLGWQNDHLWLFPIHMWRLPPSQWGAEREKRGKPHWPYDYQNGRLASVEEIWHRYDERTPARQRCIAKRTIRRAQALLDTGNGDPRHRARIMLGMIAHNAFLFLFFGNTGANESVVREIESGGEIDDATLNQNYRSIKYRAGGKAIPIIVPATFMPSLRRFMALRRYLLEGKDFPYLFFTLGKRNESPPAQVCTHPLHAHYQHQLHLLDPKLPLIGTRKLRASVDDYYKRRVDGSVAAKVLGHSEEVSKKSYSAGSQTNHRIDMTLFLEAVSESARKQRVIPTKDASGTTPLDEGGRCDAFGHPEALVENVPVKPNCKDSQGCLFCAHRVLVACEDDTRKVASAAFVMEQVILGPMHEEALRPLIIKCEDDLKMIARFKNCHAMVERVRKDVFENGNLTPFFADKYQLFLEIGIVA